MPRAADNIFSTKLIFPWKWSEGAPKTSSQEQILFICCVIHNAFGSVVPSFPATSTFVQLHLRPSQQFGHHKEIGLQSCWSWEDDSKKKKTINTKGLEDIAMALEGHKSILH